MAYPAFKHQHRGFNNPPFYTNSAKCVRRMKQLRIILKMQEEVTDM
jgi:hypothetical protein